MKKILALVMSVAMILSIGAIAVSAAVGYYGPGGKDAFKPLDSRIDVEWRNDLELDLEDYGFADWDAAGITPITIDDTNVVSWLGQTPEDWEMSARFTVDKDYLYIGVNIVDEDVVVNPYNGDPIADQNATYYGGGDVFQLSIDFGNLIKWTLENDTENPMQDPRVVFYSIGYMGDKEDVYVSVRNSGDDRVLGKGDAIGVNTDRVDVDVDNPTDTGTMGKTFETDDGWGLEFRLPLSELFYDYCYKTFNEGWNDMVKNSITIDENKPLEIGFGLYNFDYTTATQGAIEPPLAVGLHSGIEVEGVPQVTWGPDDLVSKLSIPYVDGMEFTCPYLLTPDKEALETREEIPEETEPEETDAPETAAPETEAPKAETKAPETAAPKTEAPKKSGCSAVVGFGAVAVLTAAAAAVVLKKKD